MTRVGPEAALHDVAEAAVFTFRPGVGSDPRTDDRSFRPEDFTPLVAVLDPSTFEDRRAGIERYRPA